MISYRPFRNSDPPKLVEVWRSQPPLRRRVQGVNVEMLERHVFSRPYFEREGLIVAEQSQRLLGFAHAGFGPTPDGATLSNELGVVSALLTMPDAPVEVGEALLDRAEQYLRIRGVQKICALGVGDCCPFYLGMYGGGELPGVLRDDRWSEFFQSHDYQSTGVTQILQRSLAGYRPRMDRNLIKVRRGGLVDATLDPPAVSWWDACTTADADRSSFTLQKRGETQPAARVVFSEMPAFSQSWGARAACLNRVETAGGDDQHHVLLYLLGESLRQLQGQGVHLVEAQVRNTPPVARSPWTCAPRDLQTDLLQRLDFEVADTAECRWKVCQP